MLFPSLIKQAINYCLSSFNASYLLIFLWSIDKILNKAHPYNTPGHFSNHKYMIAIKIDSRAYMFCRILRISPNAAQLLNQTVPAAYPANSFENSSHIRFL